MGAAIEGLRGRRASQVHFFITVIAYRLAYEKSQEKLRLHNTEKKSNVTSSRAIPATIKLWNSHRAAATWLVISRR